MLASSSGGLTQNEALVYVPSGEFLVNGAGAVLGVLVYNLLRWTQLIGLPDTTVRAAQSLPRLIQIAGRLTRHGRVWTRHRYARWPGTSTKATRSTASALPAA